MLKINKLQAKLSLYSILLKMPNDKMTDVEVELAYQLAQDDEIQEVLNESVKKECVKDDATKNSV